MSSYKKASKCLSWLIRPNKPLTLDNSSKISGSIAPSRHTVLSKSSLPIQSKGKRSSKPPMHTSGCVTHSLTTSVWQFWSVYFMKPDLLSNALLLYSTLRSSRHRHLSQSIFLPPWTIHRVKCFSPLFHLKYVCWPRTFSFPTYLVRNNKFSDLNSQYI